MIDDKDFPEWMRLGKADCGWSNIAADETSPKYIREDVVDAMVADFVLRIGVLEADNNRLRRRTEFKT
jgi:hypothetical protein